MLGRPCHRSTSGSTPPSTRWRTVSSPPTPSRPRVHASSHGSLRRTDRGDRPGLPVARRRSRSRRSLALPLARPVGGRRGARGRWEQFDDGSPETAAALARHHPVGIRSSTTSPPSTPNSSRSRPREADRMDPQQRLLLEVAVEALEHAGIPAESLRRTPDRGLRRGLRQRVRLSSRRQDLRRVDAWTGTGGALSIIANRLSYFLDLRGPSVAVDTACSSSLVAIHLACQSLRLRESDLALAAGVNLILAPDDHSRFDSAGALSPHGPVQDLRRRAPTGSCAARAAGSWCSSGSSTRCATATGCWPWSAVRRSIRTAAPTD